MSYVRDQVNKAMERGEAAQYYLANGSDEHLTKMALLGFEDAINLLYMSDNEGAVKLATATLIFFENDKGSDPTFVKICEELRVEFSRLESSQRERNLPPTSREALTATLTPGAAENVTTKPPYVQQRAP